LPVTQAREITTNGYIKQEIPFTQFIYIKLMNAVSTLSVNIINTDLLNIIIAVNGSNYNLSQAMRI